MPRARSDCAARIVRRFLITGLPGDVTCAAQVPPVHLVTRFATEAGQLEPAEPLPANRASAPQLQAVAATMLTVGDILARVYGNTSGQGAGLRGGTYRLSRSGQRIHLVLTGMRWVQDVAVDGTVDAPAGRDGIVRATLRMSPADGVPGHVTVSWRADDDRAAQIQGAFGGATVMAQSAAPLY